MRIREILDVDMVVLITTDSRFAGNTPYCPDSCLVPSDRLNDLDGQPGIHYIPICKTDAVLIGNIRHAQVHAEVPSQVEFGVDLPRDIPKNLFAKLNHCLACILAVER